VSEGNGSDCIEATDATEESKPVQETKSAPETKAASPGKSKSARSRRQPSFLRRVDRFLSNRR